VSGELVPLTQTQARAFVAAHHRHSRVPRGDVIRVGLAVDGQLVGVATAGRPVAAVLDDGRTLEVTRVCTLGTTNACSRLHGAIGRAAAALGYRTLITYTLEAEPGASLRASGYRLDATLEERDWSTQSGRDRYQQNLLGERITPPGRKLRWRRTLAP